MLLKSWDRVKLICGNHGDDYSHEMKIQQGPHSLFYSCPEYKSIHGTDHEGRSCNNRLTFVDFEKMLEHLIDLTLGMDGLHETNLEGLTWTKNGVQYKVLKHNKNGTYEVAMLNKKAIAK